MMMMPDPYVRRFKFVLMIVGVVNLLALTVAAAAYAQEFTNTNITTIYFEG